MQYSQIIIYRRNVDNPDVLDAYRVSNSGKYGHYTVVKVSIADMFRGHAQWVANQIPNNSKLKEAA